MPLTEKEQKNAKIKVLRKRISNLTIQFIRMEADQEMHFVNLGNEEKAKRFVQSMRVKLSRIRKELRARGMKIKSFRMRLKSIILQNDKETCKIILTKTAPIAVIEKELHKIFNASNTEKESDVIIK